jgi:hypothetical protein
MGDGPLSNRVQALVDRSEIWDCMLRYARGVDRLDEELIRSAYWTDAHDSHGRINGSIDNFLREWMLPQPSREVAFHILGNHLVKLDGASADAETYFVSAAKSYEGDQLELVGGRYLDRFERRQEQWRIKTRLVLLDWQCTADASGMTERLAAAHRGSRGPGDPSYESPVRLRHGVERRS